MDTVSVGFIHPGEWSAAFGNSLLDLIVADVAGPQRIVSHRFGLLQKNCGSGQLVESRNYVTQRFLDDSEADWLFMIDTDMGFDADTVERLLEVASEDERPIVGGLCFAMKSAGVGPRYASRYRATPTIYMMARDGDEVGFAPILEYPDDKLVHVDATGAACLLVHRSVFSRIRDEWGDVWFDKLTKPGTRSTFGEDLSFCMRAKALDIPMFVHTGVKTTHDKGGVFLDEDTYQLQQAMLEVGRSGE